MRENNIEGASANSNEVLEELFGFEPIELQGAQVELTDSASSCTTISFGRSDSCST